MSEFHDLLQDSGRPGPTGDEAGDPTPPDGRSGPALVTGTAFSASARATADRRKAVVSDLDPSEQVVVWVVRQWLSGDTGERIARQELFNLCRLTGIEPAIQGLECLIDTLGRCARRVMILHCCQCREVSHDERLLLFLIAAAQRDEGHLVQALARWLVPTESMETLIESARSLALALSQGGHRLPLELPPPPKG